MLIHLGAEGRELEVVEGDLESFEDEVAEVDVGERGDVGELGVHDHGRGSLEVGIHVEDYGFHVVGGLFEIP